MPATDLTPAAARALQRITTGYDPHQDRLRLAGECADGSTHTVWLTQRLLTRLLPPLWHWLEQHTPLATDGSMSTAEPPLSHQQTRQHFNQQAGLALPPPQPPVNPGELSPQWLVQSVQTSFQPGVVVLHLHNVVTPHTGAFAAPSLHLTLTALALRQWLAIVLQQYQQAEWATQHWPAWLTTSSAGGHDPATHSTHRLLH